VQALVCNFGKLKLWAERGLIHIEDVEKNDYRSISVHTALHRVKGIADMLQNSRASMMASGFMDSHTFDRNMRMIEQMIEICRVAQEQGMPDDPSAAGDLKRRRPVTVVMPTEKMCM
jgi:hypothetical protein